MKKGIATLTVLAFALGLYCLAPINNPPGATGSTGPAGSPGISGSPGPQGSPGPTATPAYLVYTALLTQSGTDAPVATVLENTLGDNPVWVYDGVGEYAVGYAGAFPDLDKVQVFFGASSNEAVLLRRRPAADTNDALSIKSEDNAGTFANNLIIKVSIEIRRWP